MKELLLYITFLCFLPVLNTFSLLLIGDSVDRFFTVEWCEYNHKQLGFFTLSERNSKNKYKSNIWAINSPQVKPWVDLFITTKDDPYFYCKAAYSNDSVTNVHMLGSSPIDKENLYGNPYRFSIARINKTLELYLKSFGMPDRIVYNTILWDVLGFFDNNKHINKESFGFNSPLFNSTLTLFKNNLIDRLNQIESILGYNVDICLRTAAWVEVGGQLLHSYNDMVRSLSKEKKYSLYDFDKDLWSTVNNINSTNIYYSTELQSKLFRDWIHPNHFYTNKATLKMLNKLYSKYFYYKGINNFKVYNTFPTPTIDIKIIKSEKKNKFFITHLSSLDGIRYKWLITNVKETFNKMHYSMGDVMIITDKLLQSIVTKGVFPNIFEKSTNYCINTVNNNKFIIINDNNNNLVIKEIKNNLVCSSLNISLNYTYNNYETYWIDEIGVDGYYP